jgi:hypothetical protein
MLLSKMVHVLSLAVGEERIGITLVSRAGDVAKTEELARRFEVSLKVVGLPKSLDDAEGTGDKSCCRRTRARRPLFQSGFETSGSLRTRPPGSLT